MLRSKRFRLIEKSLRRLIPFLLLSGMASTCFALSSTNIPLDSPIYGYLDKLAGYGLVTSDFKGIKPISKAEAARLVLEAQQRLDLQPDGAPELAHSLMSRLRELLPREVSLTERHDKKPPFFDYNLNAGQRLRYAYVDGVPRNYLRQVHDPGNDGVFGIGSGLRPKNPYPTLVTQRGSEGTPLMPYNNGIIYRNGHNLEMRWAAEAFISSRISGLLETSALLSKADSSATLRINRGYLKIGGGSLELEAGKDENWLGFGYRGNITLTNNAKNFTQVKLSSPEPFKIKYLGDMKFVLVGSRFENTVTDGIERQPWFYALKLSLKPTDNLEIGFNLGRQVGGPGVNNSLGDTLRGLIGGTNSDNSNSLAGFELRYRIPWLRFTELYGEFSGEDTASFWPIVESYVAGFYIPMLTKSGRDDLRFEFFQGNRILYTNGTFPAGYLYKNLPIGHALGGATQDFFLRYSHWFGVRNNLALEYNYTNRGKLGRLPGQAVEHVHAGRASWTLPVYGDFDSQFTYGIEKIANFNLVDGVSQINQLFSIELRYRY